MIWVNRNLINKSLFIVLCVVFLKVIYCTAEDHGLQMYNSTSDLSYQLYGDDDSNIDNSEDGRNEEDGREEKDEEDDVSEDPSTSLMFAPHGHRFESLHPTPPRTLAVPHFTRFRRDYIQEYRRHGGLRHEQVQHRHYNSRRESHKGKSHGHGRHGSSHGKRRSIKKTRVTMPSGTKFYITRPNISKWHCGTTSTPTKLITLNPNGKMGKKEYDMVAQEMKAAGTGLNYQIVKIEKVINGCFWRRYRARQSVIFGDGKKINERMLFHGSRKMTEILKSGFDERHAAITGAFGPGIYFSPQSSTSNIFTGAGPGIDGKMLLCRVTVGNLYKAPTYPDRHSHAPPGYHSVGGGAAIGDLNNEVIVYRGEQAYAEYMITYKL